MTLDLSKTKILPGTISVSPYSRCAVRLEPLRLDEKGDATEQSKATGFFWSHNGRLLLITNKHVATGTNPNTNECLSFWPNGINLHFFADRPRPAGGGQQKWEMGAFSATIVWNEYELEREWVFPNDPKIDIAITCIHWEHGDWKPVCLNRTGVDEFFDGDVSEDVFIIGYPEGHSFERRLPLWKRGSIATDPSLDQAGLPQFYVDTIGNRGLSGSPVLLKQKTTLIGDSTGRTRKKFAFAGIYAGRLSDSDLGSQIGRVFKARAILELIEQITD